MKFSSMNTKKAWACALLLAPTFTYAFDSGSTGVDGAFSPAVNTVLQVPPSGVFNFTTVSIPTGVTVTFKKNATNTPVVMLASGNVTIQGALSVTGGSATHSGASHDGNLGDDGLPGIGGPGGYDGGIGGKPGQRGSAGLGPGGGTPGQHTYISCFAGYEGGGGGGFASAGAPSYSIRYGCGGSGTAGTTYGSSLLLPLIGGSGGGAVQGGQTSVGLVLAQVAVHS
jgi:hypothetical protein